MPGKTLALFVLSASFLLAPTRISIVIDSNVEFDLSLLPYPATQFPAYYYPTLASPGNPQGISIEAGYQKVGPSHSISNMFLSTRASSNFSPTVSCSQLFFAADGEPLPPLGMDPPGGNWRAFSTLYQQIEQFRVTRNSERFNRSQDFIFQSEPDDEPTNSSTTIYYRVYGL